MTLDPTIEARVRAKREARLDRDHDALALLDEVERLRGTSWADALIADIIERGEHVDAAKGKP